MGGKAINSTVISIRVPNALAMSWREKADQAGIPLSEYVLRRATRPDDTLVDLSDDGLADHVDRERYQP